SAIGFTATGSASTGGNWLQVSQSASRTPADVTVTANPGSLSPGVYNGSVQLVPQNGGNSITLGISLLVAGSGGGGGGAGGAVTISVSPNTLDFRINSNTIGTAPKPAATFPLVRASGTGSATLTTKSTSTGGWLSASLASSSITAGGNPVAVTVTIDATLVPTTGGTTVKDGNITFQVYTGTVTITASPGNSVDLTVTASV